MEENEPIINLDRIKKLCGIIGTIGVGLLISDAADAVIPENAKPIAKLIRKLGGYVIGGLVAKACKDYIFASVDEIAENVTEFLENGEDENNEQPEPAETA